MATAAAASKLNGKRKLLDDSDSDSDDGGAALNNGFQVDEEFARRLEHNKKREERQRLEEKYKNQPDDDDDESSSTDETEDEDGFLATEDLDAQISATLNAIRSKDPRVYDKQVSFYQPDQDDEESGRTGKPKTAKPVTLRDYQREKLLRGDTGASDDEGEEEAPPQTYAQEQAALKKSIVSEIHAAGDAGDADSDSDDDGFMKRKEPAAPAANGVHASRTAKIKTVPDLDVDNAHRDPENFLSNFLAARAWVPEEGGRWKAFESDDGSGSENEAADEFEQAYNMRFEDPTKSNEVLKSYSRDLANSRSVRRDEKTGRAKQRELERERKEAERRTRHEEKARLKKLKLEETAEKLKKVRRAAGKSGRELTDEEWMKFLDDAWDDDKWEEAMNKRFGDEYYAQQEVEEADSDDEDAEDGSKRKKRKAPKKPTWDDDIDIKDIIPDFDDDTSRPAITLSDAEDKDDEEAADSDEDGGPPSKKRKKTDHKKARQEAQRKSRKERSKLEALVDSKLELTHHPLLSAASQNDPSSSLQNPSTSSGVPAFRYRETSPESFGMTARDILLAPSDKHLNEYAGLKKLATFRDEEKKRKDKKRLGKKARLRQWRRDVFGRDFEREGPTYGFEKFAGEIKEDDEDRERDGEQEKKKKKRKRSKGKKSKEADAVDE